MRRGSRGLRRVHVVLADIEHRKFPGRRYVEAFVKGPGIRCAIAEERDCYTALALHLRREAGAGDDRDAAGDDAVGAEHADAEIGDVHRTAFALAVARLSSVKLGHHAVEIGPLGDAVPVAAMCRDDAIVAAQSAADPDRHRLLADIA